ncbi:ThiF family protein [Algoriphagus locisalis]|uniref:ThiF family protein n=1 Tax=Algoriphagus locisalis TaxID=305507 RepID=A0A1I7DY33_9BACT|nr:Rv1355c family protein [Algoriphagus locisalis]SFU16607.1 ThiF family protein [Algoriphagus locisalis]
MLDSTQIHLDYQMLPLIFVPKDFLDSLIFRELYDSQEVTLLDHLDDQVKELIKANNPSQTFSNENLDAALAQFFEEYPRDQYGNWVYYPWRKVLVRLLPEEDFIKVRTQRNHYKITPEEQRKLREKKVGIIGLSVGQSIAYAMTMERGFGELRLADFDTLELSNLNRINAGVMDLGIEKVVLAARTISEIDPYLKLKVYREGISEANIEEFLSDGGNLDLLIDECDSLDIKILARERARSKQIPVLMETSDRGMLDVERFDLEPSREIFHGLLGEVDYKELKLLTKDQKVPMALKITGISTVSTRMKASLLEVNQTITSWPQLGSSVFLGGASIAHSSRKLLLGDIMDSGRYYVDLDDIIHQKPFLQSTTPPIQETKIDSLLEHLPTQGSGSDYLLSREELLGLIAKANTAPSGGNAQPWKWVYDKQGVLHLLHDKQRSISLLDYKGTGSLLAFGAALENLRLEAARIGIAVKIDFQIERFDQELIASVYFVSKNGHPLQVPHGSLVEGIDLRSTNRKNTSRARISEEKLDSFKELANELGIDFQALTSDDQLKSLSPILGGMDRIRLLHEQGYKDFISEIRWSDQEAIQSKDGIDVATLELEKGARAAMGLIKDPGTVEFFRKHDLGHGLSKIGDNTILTSSAVVMLSVDEYSPQWILKAGIALQRIWIAANLAGFSVQPVSASLFIFQRVKREVINGFTEMEVSQIGKFENQLDQLFPSGMKEKLFMIRINQAGEPSMRSYRKDITESLIIL